MKREIAREMSDEIRRRVRSGLDLPIVAEQFDLPIKIAARIASGGRTAVDPEKRSVPVGMLLKPDTYTAAAPSLATKPYWDRLGRVLETVPVQVRVRRGLTFEDLMVAMVTALSWGRGAA